MSLSGRRVAVVGSGITGLSSAWLLHKNGASVTLFEKDSVLGGHTLTDETGPYPVDLGFQVFNLTTYPNFVGFLDCLGVDSVPSNMSFALSMDEGKLEWASHSLDSVFAQRGNLASPSFLGMLRDVIRFGKEAPKVLEEATLNHYKTMTLGEYLKRERYSQTFIKCYVVPMCAAVWSVPSAQVLQFPVQMLIRFWKNHHLLDITQRPLWRVVKGRSKSYVQKVMAELSDVRLSTGIASVRRQRSSGDKGPAVTLITEAGEELGFDAVVFGTHSDVTLKILGEDAEAQEVDILGAIPYCANEVYLHTDTTLMPVNRKAWASWNFIGRSDDSDTAAVCVSYWANLLQHLPADSPDLFVTLNPPKPPAADKTVRKLTLAHPVFGFQSWRAQEKVAGLQGTHSTFYAGAWCGNGFHEDGIKAAVEVVKCMGGSIPWTCRSTSPKSTWLESCYLSAFDRYAKATIVTGKLRMILPSGDELHYGSLDSIPNPSAETAWRKQPPLCATLRIYSMDFFRRIVVRHDTGLGEAYMHGDFETEDLGAFLAVIVANASSTETNRKELGWLNWIGERMLHWAHLRRPNTIQGSRKNIEEHYDAGNDMYKLFLDESMMYSSAIHQEGDTLFEAQMRKLDAIIDEADLKAGDRVLEIGCGWGGFAIRAAQRTGCHITGLTLSKEQLAEATKRVKKLGLEDRITFLFCDYRDCQGTFDKVVSIEMIEAVGHEHLTSYFQTIGRVLKPGGKAVLQAICTPDERYEAYCACSDFIREHIFPGGHLPCIGACVEAARGTGLSLRQTTDIGLHYAVTLREWGQQWEEKKAEVLKLGYSELFWRKFRFYFSFCEAGFDGKYIYNYHMTWVKQHSPSPALASIEDTRGLVTAYVTPAYPAAALSASAAAVTKELPSDAFTQALLALYFFLVGMLVRGHQYMWILPLVSSMCAASAWAIHASSHLFFPRYTHLAADSQAWWCADVLHLAYSLWAGTSSILYLYQNPSALSLANPPGNDAQSSVIAAGSTGFFAFYLFLCVRHRLFTRTLKSVVWYTVLLLLYGIAVYKGENVSFLVAMLTSELATVCSLACKLQTTMGASKSGIPSSQLDGLSACIFRALPSAAAACIILSSPSSFSSTMYYVLAASAMAYSSVEGCKHAIKRLKGTTTAVPTGKQD